MTRRLPLLVLLASLQSLLPATAPAQTTIGATQPPIYRLADTSSFESGCFAPCLCPVQLKGSLIGAFKMTAGAPDPLYRVFNITDLNWFVPDYGYWVTGSGTYKVGGEFALTQELSLDLKVADRDVQHYDSGVVAGGGEFPAVNITISMNNMVCNDTVFRISARPAPPIEVIPYALYNSQYEEGCFGPCACAIQSKPLFGRFGLLKIGGTDPAADFAVVNVQWFQHDPASSTATGGTPVTGAGLYHIDTTARDQRMRLALVENGVGPTRFDSGDRPWKGALRRIDIDVAANGFACYDRVYAIHAKGRSATTTLQLTTPEPIYPVVVPTP